ncbi:MAG TPA: serine hydrolase domain-containing protein [Candidatus Dormibacteraeota bacterium]|nr:serine hydrolase domain-containing protein [Candidatus Dormibacteraeota bacterium]
MATTQDIVGLRSELERKLAESAERHQVPGAAVGVALGDQEVSAFHGVTSLENPLPVDERTLFQIGSTTKTFTATAIMRLVEAGRIDLAAPVRTYVPELELRDEDVAARVTVLHLLNHTAGWTGDYFEDTGEGDDALARYVAKMAELEQVTPLGATASYNNAAFKLAGRVIERVTGQTYEAALRELVLDPLGLRDSLLFLADVMTRRFAVGHQQHGDEMRVARRWHLSRSARPAGGIVATAADQIRYARFHLGDGTAADGGRVLQPETLARMQIPTASLQASALGDSVGISWLLKDIAGVRLVRHGGTTNGQLSAFVLVPEREFAITVLTNSDTGGQLHQEIVKWALETYLGVAEPEPEPLSLGPDELAPYAGRYRTANGLLELVVEGDRLVANATYSDEALAKLRSVYGDQIPEQQPIPIKLLPDDRFVVVEGRGKGGRGYFVREGGAISGVDMGGRLAPRVREE